MADPAGQKKTDIRTRFKKQMDALKLHAEKSAKALENVDQSDWMIPDRNEWDGDLFQISEMRKPFDRQEHYDDFVTVLSSAKDPGTVADLAAIQLQGDWLAAMERAFRERHKSHVRCAVQASARQHGHDKKVFEKMLTGYIQRILAKGAGGSE